MLSALLMLACVAGGAASTPAMAVPEAAWLPVGSQLIVRVRYADLGGSALFRSLMKSKPMFKEEMGHIDRFLAAAGIDPARELDSALIATDGREGGESVAVLAGRLSLQDLGPRLDKRGAATEKYGAVVLYSLMRAATGERPAAPSGTVAAMPRAGVAVIGTRGWVRLALDRLEGRGESAAGSATMGPLLRRLDESASVWTAAGSTALAHQVDTQLENDQIGSGDLQAVKNLVASFRIARDIRIDSEAATETEDDATLLAMTVRGLITLGGLRVSGSDPALADALRGLKVDRTSGGVRVTGQIPASVAERM